MRETTLERLEEIVDASGVAESIEALLPVGSRPRQLHVRTLLVGMLLVARHGGPAHLVRVHGALSSLPVADKWRLGVIVSWRSGEHELTYRQLEYTFALIVEALAKERVDGAPSEALQAITDALLEASVAVAGCPDSRSCAIDWTDLCAWSRPPHRDGRCAEKEAAWGHRTSNHPSQSETFFGYYLQAITMVREEQGPEVAELVRRIHLASPRHDPPAQIVAVLERMAAAGIALGDVLVDSGYAYREAQTFALRVRALGAELVMDLHPNDRGAKGTHQGAVIFNGNLYCPATPKALLELSPLSARASSDEAEQHDRKCSELHRYKLRALSATDHDGYRRVACPAVGGKLRCPLRPGSLALSHTRPTIANPPAAPPVCCTQQTLSIPPEVAAKTRQKHDYPSKAHRRSYRRRSAAERANASVKDPASNDISRGFCRLMGLTANALFIACVFAVRNLRTAEAFACRQAEEERRAALGLARKRRKRRRRTIAYLLATANAPPMMSQGAIAPSQRAS